MKSYLCSAKINSTATQSKFFMILNKFIFSNFFQISFYLPIQNNSNFKNNEIL
jgi:hypothetical protein